MDSGNIAGTQNYSFGPGWTLEDVGDFDGRGRHDLLWRGPDAAQIWFMDGPVITNAVAFNIPAGWQVGGVGDFDGDGRDDIVWINPTGGIGQIWLMNGGTVAAATNFTLPPASWALINVQPYGLIGKAQMLWYNPSINTIQVWKMDGGSIVDAENFHAGVGWAPN
jgi:hypothetical protein